MKHKNTIVPISILTKEFETKLESFDYDFYECITADRSLNEVGLIKASELLLEITRISAFFISKKIQLFMGESDVCICAYWGWKLEYDFISRQSSNITINRALTKISKQIHKEYKKAGLPVSLADTSRLIYFCALIKDKFYKHFNYNLYGIYLDQEKINVLANYDHANFN